MDAGGGGSPIVLAGEATEDWTGDARYYEYSTAVDPISTGAISRIPVTAFPASIHQDADTSLIPLDLSGALGVPYPAPSPALLAAFLSIGPTGQLTTGPDATSELYYCMQGGGRTESLDLHRCRS